MNGLKKVTAILLCVVLLGTAVISVRAANAVPKEVLRAAASAVRIIAEYEDDYACGSGFLVQNDAQGIYVLTNYHVVEDEPQAVYVLIGDEEIQVEVHAFSRQKDLCILSLPYAPAVEPVRFSAKDAVQGDAVYAVGFPAAADDLSDTLAHTSEDATITDGIVSALRTATTSEYGAAVKLLQINAAINPGNSGGALVNADGQVIGINSAKISKEGVEGLGFAIPINTARPILESLIKNGKVARPYLGLYGMDQKMAARFGEQLPIEGIYVYKVVAGGPLDRAGIRHGDIITKIGDAEIKAFADLQSALGNYSVGDTVEVTYQRGNAQQTASVTLQETPVTDDEQ